MLAAGLFTVVASVLACYVAAGLHAPAAVITKRLAG
jgi:hypothetical protein